MHISVVRLLTATSNIKSTHSLTHSLVFNSLYTGVHLLCVRESNSKEEIVFHVYLFLLWTIGSLRSTFSCRFSHHSFPFHCQSLFVVLSNRISFGWHLAQSHFIDIEKWNTQRHLDDLSLVCQCHSKNSPCPLIGECGKYFRWFQMDSRN